MPRWASDVTVLWLNTGLTANNVYRGKPKQPTTIILNFDFSDLDYEMDTCFLHSMLHFTFALKKGFHRNVD